MDPGQLRFQAKQFVDRVGPGQDLPQALLVFQAGLDACFEVDELPRHVLGIDPVRLQSTELLSK